MPFGSQEAAYQNPSTLGYLSSEQALADYATLIVDLKRNLTAEESSVIVFGGSYGGSKSLNLISLEPLSSFSLAWHPCLMKQGLTSVAL